MVLFDYVPRQSAMADERSVVTATAFRKIPLETAGTNRLSARVYLLAVRFHEAYEYVRPLDLAVDYAAVAFSSSHSAPRESQIPKVHLGVQRSCLGPARTWVAWWLAYAGSRNLVNGFSDSGA